RASLHEPVFILPQTSEPRAANAAAATVDKGQQIFDATVMEIVDHLRSVTEAWGDDTVRVTALSSATFAIDTPQPPEAGIRVRNLVGADWEQALRDTRVAVLPMGAASKEHGYHLPNQTDYLTAEALGAAAVEHAPI